MARGRVNFKETDLTRAIKAVKKAGLPVVGAEVAKDGTIRIVCFSDDARTEPRAEAVKAGGWEDAR